MSYNPRIKIGADGSLIISGNVQLLVQSNLSSSTLNSSYVSSSFVSSSLINSASMNTLYNTGSGLTTNLTNVTSNITLSKNGHIVILDATNQSVTVNLPSASQLPGQEYTLKRVDGSNNSISISGQINNVATQINLINKNDLVVLLSDGTSSWWRI